MLGEKDCFDLCLDLGRWRTEGVGCLVLGQRDDPAWFGDLIDGADAFGSDTEGDAHNMEKVVYYGVGGMNDGRWEDCDNQIASSCSSGVLIRIGRVISSGVCVRKDVAVSDRFLFQIAVQE